MYLSRAQRCAFYRRAERIARTSEARLRFVQAPARVAALPRDERSLSAVRQANWVLTVAPGDRWRENGYDVYVLPRAGRRLEPAFIVSASIRASKHPIVLSVSRSRVHHLFFYGGICQAAPPILRNDDEELYDEAAPAADDDIWIAKASPLVDGESDGRYHRSEHCWDTDGDRDV